MAFLIDYLVIPSKFAFIGVIVANFLWFLSGCVVLRRDECLFMAKSDSLLNKLKQMGRLFFEPESF